MARIVSARVEVLAIGKRFFYRQLEMKLEEAYALAAGTITCNMLGPDAQEGVGAFVAKRKPSFRK